MMDETPNHINADAPIFGYDQTGRAHRWDPTTATVVVTVDGDVEHTEELSREAVPNWLEFVDEKCGWIAEWWHDTKPPWDKLQAVQSRAADIRYEQAKKQEVPA